MALMAWNESYSVGVMTIDSQHKGLFEMVNELHTAMMQGKGQAVTGPLLKKLMQYTREHFSAEEKMLETAKYPGLAGHRTLHRDMTKEVDDLIARYERGEGSINVELLQFLSNWLTKHIQGVDKGYAPWLNQHGVR